VLDTDIIKVASGETVNVPFLRDVARTGLPVIMSTGMCDMGDVRLGVDTLNAVWDAAGRRPALTLMNCTTSYPTPMHEVHLRSMRTLADTFGCPVGLSDHSAGISAALASVALGATVIEKHFTLDRSMPGPDHAASLDPAQLKALVAGVREVEQAMGSPVKERRACEADLTNTIRRSLVAVRDIAPGETIAADMLVALRPEDGIPARDIDKVVGRPAWRAFAGGEVLRWDGAEAS
ncbi:MAG: N-acetylneuraminate synthase family protein, partial [Alphaproteobacteria bacterium]